MRRTFLVVIVLSIGHGIGPHVQLGTELSDTVVTVPDVGVVSLIGLDYHKVWHMYLVDMHRLDVEEYIEVIVFLVIVGCWWRW